MITFRRQCDNLRAPKENDTETLGKSVLCKIREPKQTVGNPVADKLGYRRRTLYTGIFTMTAIMVMESTGNAVLDKCFPSSAAYVI